MNRLYVVESTPSLTGAMADHRISLAPNGIANLLRQIRTALEPDGSNPSSGQDKFISALAGDLRQNAGKSLVIAGSHEPPAVLEFARWCNERLGNVNVTVDYVAPDVGRPDLGELVKEINSGSVETLLIIGGNPVYDAPADLEFAGALAKVPNSIHIDLYANETAERCRWHIPEAHALESWSDACAFDGTATIMQPVIEPLFAGRSRHQLLAALLEEASAESYDIMRGFWHQQLPAADFERIWRKSLHDGMVTGWRSATLGPSAERSQASAPAPEVGGLYLLIRADPHIGDGRFSNNAWLQELPKPLTKLVWENAAFVSPATAERLQLVNEDVVELRYRARSVQAPVWILPGQADDCVTVHFGYGRGRAGSIGSGIGFNANEIRMSDALWGGPGLQIEKTGRRQTLVTTQHPILRAENHVLFRGSNHHGDIAPTLVNPAGGGKPPGCAAPASLERRRLGSLRALHEFRLHRLGNVS